MSMIVCAQDCRHQSDGYCALNRITSLSGSREAKCGYYEKIVTSAKDALSAGAPSTENTESLR